MHAIWRHRRTAALTLLLAALPLSVSCTGCTDIVAPDAGWSIDTSETDASADLDTEPTDGAEPDDASDVDVEAGPDVQPDTEVGTDSGDARDTDDNSDEDDETYWDDFGDSCPPDTTVFPRETVSQAAQSAPGSEPLELQWAQKDICPTAHTGDDLLADFGIALGGSIPGGSESSIFAQVGDPGVFEVPGTAKAVAMLDASNGENIRCPRIATTLGARATRTLTTVGSPERVFDATMGKYATPSNSPGPQTSPHFAFHAFSSDGSTLFEREETDASMRGDVGPLLVKGDGQLVLLWKSRRIVSFDGTTGAVHWVLAPRDVPALRQRIEASGRTCTGFDPRCTPEPKDHGQFRDLQLLPGGELVAWGEVDGEEDLVVIDRCGTGSVWSGPPADADVMKVDGTYIFQTGDELKLYKRSQSVPTGQISNCDAVTTPATDRIACLDRESNEIREHRTDGSLVQTHMLPSLPGTISYATMTAARGGYVLLAAGDKSGTPSVRIVELPDSGSPRHHEQAKPNQHAKTGTTRPPLVAQDGAIVFSRWARLYAVDGNFPGLAAGPYPRGPRLGGNRNQGYVEVSTGSNP